MRCVTLNNQTSSILANRPQIWQNLVSYSVPWPFNCFQWFWCLNYVFLKLGFQFS